jgi:hypothetical protein
MNNKINLDLNLFKIILDQEAKKLTGKTMKRFELSKDIEIIKKEVKELQYEAFRDIYDMLLNGKIIFQIENKDTKKE